MNIEKEYEVKQMVKNTIKWFNALSEKEQDKILSHLNK